MPECCLNVFSNLLISNQKSSLLAFVCIDELLEYPDKDCGQFLYISGDLQSHVYETLP